VEGASDIIQGMGKILKFRTHEGVARGETVVATPIWHICGLFLSANGKPEGYIHRLACSLCTVSRLEATLWGGGARPATFVDQGHQTS